ncbi:hypothetical protein BKA70DRAFT_1417034 [Coprinopsis sp. MPI-PUGE-AT-0042]|nr:hypothetical protein BKA70DRAFT_1417034 [Coprinopsis sp. MPI-PUGE-AT-0042]
MEALRYTLERVAQALPAPATAILRPPWSRSSESTLPIWNLPEDIFLHILDFLTEDMPSLKALCLTSVCFKASCQRHLFAKLILRSSNVKAARGTIGKELLQLFEGCPAIPFYVRQLEIHDRGRSTNPQWLLDDEDLARALSLLDPNRIEQLALRRGPTRAEEPLDTQLSGALVDILRSMCRSDSLKTLTLGWISHPDIFALCRKSLRHLEIAEGMCTTFHAMEAPPPRHPVRIKSLTTLFPSYYGSLPEIIRCLLAASMWIDLSHVTRLTVATRDYNDMSHALLLAGNCALSLEELCISAPQHIHRHGQLGIIDFSGLPKLRSIGISCRLEDFTCHAQNCSWAVSSLRTLANPNAVERISFSITYVAYESSEASLGGLEELDELLVSNSRFPTLGRVHIHLGLCQSATERVTTLSDIHDRVPRLGHARLLGLTSDDGHK